MKNGLFTLSSAKFYPLAPQIVVYQRTQLIMTTHSDILLDALSDTPEAVIVCEKENGATQMRRLDQKQLQSWLVEYSLGGLWRSGEVGGNRW